MWTLRVNEASLSDKVSVKTLSKAQLILVFGTRRAFEEDLPGEEGHLSLLRKAAPQAIITGTTTGTAIEGRSLNEAGWSGIALSFEKVRIRHASVKLQTKAKSYEAGKDLAKSLCAPDLRYILLLSPGLDVDGSALIDGVSEGVGENVIITGGLAGDGAAFEKTYVLNADSVSSNDIVAVALYGEALRVGAATGGGWKAFGPEREVTSAVGTVLKTLDDGPALDLYETYLGEEAAQLPASALMFPLKIHDPDHPTREVVRTVLSIDRSAKTLTFAGSIPQNWPARLMRGQPDHLVSGAEAAIDRALSHLRIHDPDLEPQLCLTVSCVGRRLLMGQRTLDEVEAVGQRLDADTVQFGFYSYGEIAPYPDYSTAGLHNQTMCLTLLSEVV